MDVKYVVYADDTNGFLPLIREAVARLTSSSGRHPILRFLTVPTAQNASDALFLDQFGNSLKHDELPAIKTNQILKAAELNDTLRDADSTIYVLDMSYGGHERNPAPILHTYGLRVALYLVSRGVSPARILLLTNHPADALEKYLDGTCCQIGDIGSKKEIEQFPLELRAARLAFLIQRRAGDPKRPESRIEDVSHPAANGDSFSSLVFRSAEMNGVINAVQKAALKSKSPILLEGETGTGKELLATAIATVLGKSLYPYNCGGMNTELGVSELFGHEKGAFTGADSRRAGKLESANDNVLFLDELLAMPIQYQTLLNRILDGGDYSRVGSDEIRRANCRIVAAANQDLDKLIAAGTFRDDLPDRFLRIKIPPLRERREDVPVLLHHFAKLLGVSIDTSDIDILATYEWPRNAREVKRALEWAHVVASDDSRPILSRDLLPYLDKHDAVATESAFGSSSRRSVQGNKSEWQEFEYEVAEFVRRQSGKSYTQFAKVLRILISAGASGNADAVKLFYALLERVATLAPFYAPGGYRSNRRNYFVSCELLGLCNSSEEFRSCAGISDNHWKLIQGSKFPNGFRGPKKTDKAVDGDERLIRDCESLLNRYVSEHPVRQATA